MAAVNVEDLAIARVYSAAMLQLAQASGEVETVLAEVNDLADLFVRDETFRAFATNPTIDMEPRKATLETLFRGRYCDLFVDALQVLNAKGRLGLIGAVAETYRHGYEVLTGHVQVFVHSATPLTNELREKVRAVANRQTGKQADLVEALDETLIGGLVMRIGDEKFDASVASKLKKLGDALFDRAAREIHGGRSYTEGAAV